VFRIAVTVQSTLTQICVMLLSDSRQVSEFCHDCFRPSSSKLARLDHPVLLFGSKQLVKLVQHLHLLMTVTVGLILGLSLLAHFIRGSNK
jgi:hypothetical protein